MTNVCHGQGQLELDGCCYVDGKVCSFRWKKDSVGTIYDSEGIVLGTVGEVVRSALNGRPRQDRAIAAIGERTFICSLAIRYEGNWDEVHSDSGYQTKVAPVWRKLEELNNWSHGVMDCGNYGPTQNVCCYGESSAKNKSKASWISGVPVRVDIGRKVQN